LAGFQVITYGRFWVFTEAGWAFGVVRRRERFSLLPSRFAGITRWRGREVQSGLSMLLHFAPETHVLLASPLVRAFNHRSRLGLSVDSAFRHRSALLTFPTTGLSGRRRRACALASVRRSNCTCGFPAYSFHEVTNYEIRSRLAEWRPLRTCQVDRVHQSPQTMMYGFFPKELIHLIALAHLTSLLFLPAFACRLPRPALAAGRPVTPLSRRLKYYSAVRLLTERRSPFRSRL
jgi:hypothetical protein